MTKNQANINLEEYEEYTEKEIEYIDKYKKISGNTLEDEEVYDLILKYNFDDKKIRDSILDHLEFIKKRGDDYNWTLVEKGRKQKITKPEEPVREPREKRNYRYNPRFQDQNLENTHSTRGQRGNRRGGNRGGNRGGQRGGRGKQNRRPFEEAVEVTTSTRPLEDVNINTVSVTESVNVNREEELPSKTVAINNVNNEEINQPHLNEETQPKESLIAEELPISTNTITIQQNQNQVHNNPASIFTIERENDNILNKLLDDKKPETPENTPKIIDTKTFFEEVLNHFMRDIQISQTNSYSIKGVPKITSKNTISQQPQVNYNQTQTTQQSTSTNKNYPQKSERYNMGQQQMPQDYMNFQQQNAFMHPYQQMMYMMMNPYMYQQQMSEMENPNVDPMLKTQKPKNMYSRENDMSGYPGQMGPYQGFPMMPQNYFPQNPMGGMPDSQSYFGGMDKSQMHKNQDLGENPNPNSNFYGNFYNK